MYPENKPFVICPRLIHTSAHIFPTDFLTFVWLDLPTGTNWLNSRLWALKIDSKLKAKTGARIAAKIGANIGSFLIDFRKQILITSLEILPDLPNENMFCWTSQMLCLSLQISRMCVFWCFITLEQTACCKHSIFLWGAYLAANKINEYSDGDFQSVVEIA